MTSLDQLVKRIDRSEYHADRSNHFIFDPTSKQFLRKQPLFGSKLYYFQAICSPHATPDAVGEIGPIGVVDPETGSQLRVHVIYEAWILPDNAQDFVRSVAGNDPGRRATDLVVAAVRQYILNDPSILATGAEHLNLRDVERSLFKDYGLSIALRIRLERDLSKDPGVLPKLDVPIHVQLADYGSELELRLRLVMSPLPGKSRQAIDAWSRLGPPAEAIAKASRDYLTGQSLRLLRSGQLDAGLRDTLVRELAIRSLALRNFQLGIITQLPEVERFYDGHTDSDIQLYNYPRPVRLHTHVQLKLDDEARYYSAESPPLQGWLEANVAKAVQRVLFRATYSELCLQLQHWEGRILIELRSAAREIGYSVEAHVTTPYAAEYAFLSPFTLEVHGEFSTEIEFVSSEMHIVLALKLDSLQSVANEMNRGLDLEKTFRDAVLQEVRSYLHTVHPRDLFTRFSDGKTHLTEGLSSIPHSGPPSVEQALRARVSTVLHERFGLEVRSFTPKQGKSALRDCYLALDRSHIQFEVVLTPLGEMAAVKHIGTLVIDTIAPNGWRRFQSLLPTPQQVREATEKTVHSLIAAVGLSPAEDLRAEEIRSLVMERLPDALVSSLGICATVCDWHPEGGYTKQRILDTRRKVLDEDAEALLEDRRTMREQVRKLRNEAFLQASQGEEQEAQRLVKLAEDLEQRKPTVPWLSDGRIIDAPTAALGAANGRSRLALRPAGAGNLPLPRSDRTGDEEPEGAG